MEETEKLNTLFDAVADELLTKIKTGEAKPADLAVAVKFLKDNNVGTGIVGAPACGDVMKLQIKVDTETDTIIDTKFKTFGCGSAIASSSLVTEWVKGKTLEEAQKLKNTEIVKELSLPPVKIHCSVLAEDAIKAAISDYKTKLENYNHSISI